MGSSQAPTQHSSTRCIEVRCDAQIAENTRSAWNIVPYRSRPDARANQAHHHKDRRKAGMMGLSSSFFRDSYFPSLPESHYAAPGRIAGIVLAPTPGSGLGTIFFIRPCIVRKSEPQMKSKLWLTQSKATRKSNIAPVTISKTAGCGVITM